MKFAQKSVPGLADVGVPHGDGDGPRTPSRWLEGVWKKFQKTNFTIPNTSLQWNMLYNQSLALLMLGSPIGMAPELHPDGWRGSGNSFKWLILLCLTTSLSWSMLKNQSLALLMLGSRMGMGMAPELRPQGLDQKWTHTTLISMKNWRGWICNSPLKGQNGRGGTWQ